MNQTASVQKRDSWRTKWGFVLACIGSAVGMGNIWMFPTRVSAYGGGTFLLAYFICVIVLGFSGLIGEMAFGRAARLGPIGAFGMATGKRGNETIGKVLGFIPTLGSFAMAIGYSVVVGWILHYTLDSFTGALMVPKGVEAYGAAFGAMASSFGNTLWQIIAVVITLAILILGISSGIEKANKFMMPIFYILFIGIAIYMVFQPGAVDGYHYIFRIDPKGLANPMVWVYALGQSFFSLSLAGNGTIIYGSYLDDDVDVVSAAWKVALFDTMAAMLAALVIIPAMASMGSKLDQGGPGLLFIYLPNLFQSLPGSRILMIIFFVAVLFAGLTSLLNLYEAPIAAVQSHLKLSRVKAVLLVGVIGLVVSICIQGIVSGWMDVLSILICPLGAALAGILFFWVLGKKHVEEEVSKGRTKPVGKWYYPFGKYVFCILTLLVLVLGIVFGGIG